MLPDLLSESREHLAEVEEDYLEHMGFASKIGGILMVAGVCCIIHSVIPALFPTSASRRIRLLYAVLQNRTLLGSHATNREIPTVLGFLLVVAVSIAGVLFASSANPMIAAPLSIIAFSYPAAFLLSNGRPDRHSG